MNSIDKNWVDNHIDSNGEVIIPEGTQVIKKYSFQGNDKVKKIVLPDSIIGIEVKSFADCPNLQEIKLSNNLQVLGMNAFQNCTSLKQIDIPSNVQTLYPGTFSSCSNLKTISLNGNLKYISADSFANCDNLEEVAINGVDRVNYNAFMQKTSIKKLTIDGQEFTFEDNEQVFSIQKVGEKVAIVSQSRGSSNFSTQCVNLEKKTSKTMNGNIYLKDDGKLCHAINSLADFSLSNLEQLKNSGLTQLYIYGGEKEVTPEQHKENINFNLYSIDDLIQIKAKILDIKKQIQVPSKQDPHKEKKIYAQITRILSENIEYDDYEAGTSKEYYEEKTGKSYDDYIQKNKERDIAIARLESRNLLGLLRGTAVCQGYAEIIRNLAAEYGINVESIRGSIPINGKKSSHEWNQVRLDGIWYDDDFTNYHQDLVNGDLEHCHCFLMGARQDGTPSTQYVGYETKAKLHIVGKTLPIADKKFLLNYGRKVQKAKQLTVQQPEKEQPQNESIKDEVGDESKPKTQEQQQNEQEAEAKWMNSFQACDQEVAKMHDGAKKKQEVVQLIQNLEQERKQEQNRQIQEENENQVQGR